MINDNENEAENEQKITRFFSFINKNVLKFYQTDLNQQYLLQLA